MRREKTESEKKEDFCVVVVVLVAILATINMFLNTINQ